MDLQVTKYWPLWMILSFLTFIIPELYWIIKRQTGKTLSGYIWNAEKLGSGNPFKWNFIHLMVVTLLIVLLAWLVGHFGWGLWK